MQNIILIRFWNVLLKQIFVGNICFKRFKCLVGSDSIPGDTKLDASNCMCVGR